MRPIYEFPDIWARGNAWEELNPSEAVICRTLIQDINAFAFQRRLGAVIVDSQGAADSAGRDMAGFLHENPGARRAWEELRDRIRRKREPHVSGEYRNAFEEEVRANLEVLDRTYNPQSYSRSERPLWAEKRKLSLIINKVPPNYRVCLPSLTQQQRCGRLN